MTTEERRTVTVTAAVLLLASLIRFGWEARPLPPVLPPEGIPAELVEETRRQLDMEERRRTPLAAGERVDPNRAPEVELSRLPGIGPTTAERIIQSRVDEGPFRRPGDLLRVTGIGPATIERIGHLLDLDAPPAGVGAPAPSGQVAGASSVPGASLAPSASPAPAGVPGALPVPGSRVDVNRAGKEELVTLPGIGPALADRILDHRRREGPFRTSEDLLQVPGIGPATLDRLRPLIRAEG